MQCSVAYYTFSMTSGGTANIVDWRCSNSNGAVSSKVNV